MFAKFFAPRPGKAAAAVAMAVVCMSVGCSSEPDAPPQPDELTPSGARALILEKWSHDEPDHFTVTFHSDILIACGTENDLWRRVETPYRGFTVVNQELTEAGHKALFSIDLKESGKFQEIVLRGPYTVEVTSLAQGAQADTRQANIRWDLDWDKAPAGIKACLPRYDLTGTRVALFKLDGLHWSFASLQRPDDAAAPAGPAPSTDAAFPYVHQ